MTQLNYTPFLAGLLCLILSDPLSAAEPPATETDKPAATEAPVDAATAPNACRDELKTFDSAMAKDGYWRSSEGNGFGYPIRAYGFGTYGDNLDRPAYGEPGYLNARPGYEVRVLNEAANILARRRQQQPCEGVLATMRAVYKHFLTEMKAGGAPMAATPDWRQRQIRAAVPVTGPSVALRSDELLGVEVRNPNNLALGSVDDLILSPRTGDIIYDVIASGGIFGFDESYVPVPWDDFKATPGASLLVLDTTKSGLDGAPHVKEDAFSVGGAADAEMQKVNAYWKARQPAKASN